MRVRKIKPRSSSPGMTGHQQGLVPASNLLRRIAGKLPPNAKVVRAAPKKRGGGNKRLTDDEAVALLVRRLRGESMTALADEFGLGIGTLQQWFAGTNRPHLIERASAIVRSEQC